MRPHADRLVDCLSDFNTDAACAQMLIASLQMKNEANYFSFIKIRFNKAQHRSCLPIVPESN